MKLLLTICSIALMSMSALAQSTPSNNDTDDRIRRLEEQVRQLQEQVRALTGVATVSPAEPAARADESLENIEVIDQAAQPSAASATPSAAQPTAGGGDHHAGGTLPIYGATSDKIFNPDIGLIGNLIAAGGQTASSPAIAASPSFTLQESEMSLQAIVDPYARADFFLAYGEEGVEVEEGYATFTALPASLLLKAGKMRANFGRLNAFHNHTLPWVDRPIVMFNLLGGSTEDPDTGIKDAGFSVSRLMSLGGGLVEVTGEVFRGDSGTLFKAAKRSDLSMLGHVKTYFDFSDAANFEGGASYARGKNEFGSDFTTQLYGMDLTYRWRPPARAIYNSLAVRSELIWSDREEPDRRRKAFGLYASADYQFARRWTAGARYDWSERAEDQELRDRGASAVLTFRPSEFSLLRLQYRRSAFAQQRTANELLFQVLFVMGAHGAHPF